MPPCGWLSGDAETSYYLASASPIRDALLVTFGEQQNYLSSIDQVVIFLDSKHEAWLPVRLAVFCQELAGRIIFNFEVSGFVEFNVLCPGPGPLVGISAIINQDKSGFPAAASIEVKKRIIRETRKLAQCGAELRDCRCMLW